MQKFVLGVGTSVVDMISICNEYPKQDQKIRSESLEYVAGGNILNGLSALSRLGIPTKLVTLIGDDALSHTITSLCNRADINISLSPRIPLARSPTSCIIVSRTEHTRTIIHSASQFELSEKHGNEVIPQLDSNDIGLVYFDGRHAQAALPIARWAANHDIDIILDAERPRGADFDALIPLATHLICSADFTTSWAKSKGYDVDEDSFNLGPLTGAATRAQSITITFGSFGSLFVDLKHRDASEKDDSIPLLRVQSLPQLQATVSGVAVDRTTWDSSPNIDLLVKVGSRYRIGAFCAAYPLEVVVDTTGAGDVFIAGFCYGLLKNMSEYERLKTASRLAAIKCTKSGHVFDAISQ